jgi:delta-aminolevulinic acid dehydratase/porphobilinogen synthase
MHISSDSSRRDRVQKLRSMVRRCGQMLAYPAKYDSAFYVPLHDAVGPKRALKGDKRTCQMDPPNCDEALREVDLDLDAGTEMLMVKPGIRKARTSWRVKAARPGSGSTLSGATVKLRKAPCGRRLV